MGVVQNSKGLVQTIYFLDYPQLDYNPYGLTLFGLPPFRLTPFGLTPFGLTPFGLTPTGLTPNLTNQMGVVQNFYHPNGWVDQHFRASYAHSGFVKPVCINESYSIARTEQVLLHCNKVEAFFVWII